MSSFRISEIFPGGGLQREGWKAKKRFLAVAIAQANS